MLEDKRPEVPGGIANLLPHKAQCKARVQAALGLQVDPSAVLISFVGRWTFEKGIDLIAEAVLWLLDKYKNVQVQMTTAPPPDRLLITTRSPPDCLLITTWSPPDRLLITIWSPRSPPTRRL